MVMSKLVVWILLRLKDLPSLLLILRTFAVFETVFLTLGILKNFFRELEARIFIFEDIGNINWLSLVLLVFGSVGRVLVN
jgi:hypothetical protein